MVQHCHLHCFGVLLFHCCQQAKFTIACPSSSPPAPAYKRAVATTEVLLTLAPLTVTLLRPWSFPWSVLMGRRSGRGILHAGCLGPSISSSTIDHGIPRIESSLFRDLGAIPVEFTPSPGVLTRILDLSRLRPESMPSFNYSILWSGSFEQLPSGSVLHVLPPSCWYVGL